MAQSRGAQRRDWLKIGGVLLTLVLHGGLVGMVALAHAHSPKEVMLPRDFMVAKIVRLGRQRPKELLPTLPTPPTPVAPPKPAVKLTENETASAAPKTTTPPPDAKPGDLKKAMARAKLLAAQQAQADPEGDPRGDPSGNSDTAAAGDLYATEVYKVYHEQWNVPQLAAAQRLTALARVFIDAQGNVLKTMLVKSSGNGPFDGSVLEVLQKVKKLPPPPRELALRFARSGLPVLEFAP